MCHGLRETPLLAHPVCWASDLAENVFFIVLGLHISMSACALFSGWIAIFLRSNAKVHSQSGTIYVYCTLSAAVLGVTLVAYRTVMDGWNPDMSPSSSSHGFITPVNMLFAGLLAFLMCFHALCGMKLAKGISIHIWFLTLGRIACAVGAVFVWIVFGWCCYLLPNQQWQGFAPVVILMCPLYLALHHYVAWNTATTVEVQHASHMLYSFAIVNTVAFGDVLNNRYWSLATGLGSPLVVNMIVFFVPLGAVTIIILGWVQQEQQEFQTGTAQMCRVTNHDLENQGSADDKQEINYDTFQ